jgi:hypothetical protein
MKAKFSGRCRLCGEAIRAGEEINILLKKWVHPTCKTAEIAARAGRAGTIVEVPMEYAPATLVVASNRRRRTRRSHKSRGAR